MLSAVDGLSGCGKGDAQILPHQMFISITVKMSESVFHMVILLWQSSWIRLTSKADLVGVHPTIHFNTIKIPAVFLKYFGSRQMNLLQNLVLKHL